eukprot:2617689-Alexandrium_andersonii.AAC.1
MPRHSALSSSRNRRSKQVPSLPHPLAESKQVPPLHQPRCRLCMQREKRDSANASQTKISACPPPPLGAARVHGLPGERVARR